MCRPHLRQMPRSVSGEESAAQGPGKHGSPGVDGQVHQKCELQRRRVLGTSRRAARIKAVAGSRVGNRRPFGSKAFHPERTLSSLPYPRGAGQGDDGADPAPVCLDEHRGPRPPALVVPCARSAASRQARTKSAKQARRTAQVFEGDYQSTSRCRAMEILDAERVLARAPFTSPSPTGRRAAAASRVLSGGAGAGCRGSFHGAHRPGSAGGEVLRKDHRSSEPVYRVHSEMGIMARATPQRHVPLPGPAATPRPPPAGTTGPACCRSCPCSPRTRTDKA
jgi:hypothetical protein